MLVGNTDGLLRAVELCSQKHGGYLELYTSRFQRLCDKSPELVTKNTSPGVRLGRVTREIIDGP